MAFNAAGRDALDRTRRDPALSAALLRAEARKRKLGGQVRTIDALARAEGVAATYAARVLRTAFLAPDLKRAILDGGQPSKLTLQALITKDLPLNWRAERELFLRWHTFAVQGLITASSIPD
jgi:hypothetical protein